MEVIILSKKQKGYGRSFINHNPSDTKISLARMPSNPIPEIQGVFVKVHTQPHTKSQMAWLLT